MREIKYRGWNGEQMLNVVRIHLDADDAIWWSDDFKQLRIYNAEHKPLMQYTGLKDRNDKEIYEGDIVEGIGGIYPIVVDSLHGYQFLWGKGHLCRDMEHAYEVIGNIYENPELLEATK